MLTNNGKAFCYVSDWLEDNSRNPRYILQRTNGTVATIYRNTTALTKKLNYNSLVQNMQIIVGSGTTAANVFNYSLENEITSAELKISYSGGRNKEYCDCSYNKSPIIMHATTTFYNSSLNRNIEINEIGLITKDETGASYLLFREVLAESLILHPDETITLTITIN